nr:pentatricopeptide repeat-containing protein At5g64320, mitochondrial-like [Nicotiana tomentosiformis]
MGLGLLPRNSSFNLLFNHLHELGLERSLYRKYYGASSVQLLYDSDKAVIPIRRSHSCKGRKLYSVIVRVCKSLSWEVAKEIPFKKAMKKYGLSHSINAFSAMVHIFVLARMDREVYALLKDIVFNFENTGIDLRNVFHFALHSSPNNATSSTVLADELVKVFAATKLLDHVIDVVNQVKKIGLKPSIYSCNFLLKCLAEASQKENLVTLFEAMKKFGPSPNVRTYTIMMNFYCTYYPGQQTGVDIKEAYKILKEMWEKQLRYENQPLNSYCYNAIIHGYFAEGEVSKAISVFEEMRSFGITPYVCSYIILIGGFCKFDSIDRALCFIQDMQDNNIKPNPISYSSILKGLCNIGAA